MARNHGKFQSHRIEFSVVLVNVTTAQAAGFNSHDGIIAAGMGNLELLHLVFSWADLHRRSRSRHRGSPRNSLHTAGKVADFSQNLELSVSQ
jgi:hypothetical protein